MTRLALSQIRTDGGTQPRASTDMHTVSNYVEAMAGGAEFPPLVVFYDGADYWLADGYHRYDAAKFLGTEIECDVQLGTRRDAILYAVGANAEHGRPRTQEDKRRAVKMLLDDPEWAAWSDREIARHCRVDHATVGKLRPPPPLIASGEIARCATPAPRKVKRGGAVYTMSPGKPTKAGAFHRTELRDFTGTNRRAAARAFPDLTEQDKLAVTRILVIGEVVAERLPLAQMAAQLPGMRQSFCIKDARNVARWFSAFADTLEAATSGSAPEGHDVGLGGAGAEP